MKITIKLSEMMISTNPEDTLIARDLGSGLAVEAYDPVHRVGGIFHCMLPSGKEFPDLAKRKPFLFADCGLPIFLQNIFQNGAEKQYLQVNLAGGACFLGQPGGVFNVGQENLKYSLAILLEHRISVRHKEVGGRQTRSMVLEVGSGSAWVEAGKEQITL